MGSGKIIKRTGEVDRCTKMDQSTRGTGKTDFLMVQVERYRLMEKCMKASGLKERFKEKECISEKTVHHTRVNGNKIYNTVMDMRNGLTEHSMKAISLME
jgi:hypothetical protein